MEEKREAHRLVLGTVQLGMPYGIANRTGQPSIHHAQEMIRAAWDAGVRFFDTAQAYGESEAVLGECLRKCRQEGADAEPRVITKLHPALSPFDLKGIRYNVDKSLERLGVPALYGLMIHREEWLDVLGEGLESLALSLQEYGKIRHFGISVYSLERAFQALQTEAIDLIQVPFNVLDQRFLRSGFFSEAEKLGKKTFIRSIYLQGLLLMPPSSLPSSMAYAGAGLERFHMALTSLNVSPQLAAFVFVRCEAPRAFYVVGAETVEQVFDNIDIYRLSEGMELPDMTFLGVSDLKVINPALWPSWSDKTDQGQQEKSCES